MNKEKFDDKEENSLNATYDSIDIGNKDVLEKYKGEFNKPQPRFKGIPEDYDPTTFWSVCLGILMCCPLYIFCGLFTWGLIEWGLVSPISLGWANFGTFMVYFPILLILIYFGAAEKKKIERNFINMKIQDQEKQKLEQQKKQQDYRDFLKKYQMKKKSESRVYQ